MEGGASARGRKKVRRLSDFSRGDSLEPLKAEPWTEADDVIEEVREIRRRISAQFDHDPAKLVEHYIEQQKQYADRLVRVPDSGKNGQSAGRRSRS